VDRIQVAAIALAVGLFAIWVLWMPGSPRRPTGAVERAPEASSRAPAGPRELEIPSPTRETPHFDAPDGDLTDDVFLTLQNDAMRVGITKSGRIQSVKLLRYPDRVGPGAGPVELTTAAGRGLLTLSVGEGPLAHVDRESHEVVTQGDRNVELALDAQGVHVDRKLELDERGYGASLRVRVENRGQAPITPRFSAVWYGAERPFDAPDHFPSYSLVVSADGVQRTPVNGLGSPGFFDRLLGRDGTKGTTYAPPVRWAGIESQYFLSAIVAENAQEAQGFTGPLAQNAGLAALSYPPFEIPSGHYVERSYRLYLGPKLAREIAAVDPRLEEAIVVGWAIIQPVVALFEFLLVWTYDNVVANYGVAIILLTILLRLVTFPLTQRSMKSMKRVGELAPRMKELQEKYGGDRERLNQEMMAMWRQQGVNPLTAMGGGCVPMLVQLPFLVALYFALQASIELRHAPFVGWINDLSAPEALFFAAGFPVRLLPLLMGATMILQQWLTPTPNADPQQKQMMLWMSVLFIFMFYGFASGLVLYWFVSNLLGIAQQLLVNWSGTGAIRVKEAT
jgi:YidC/Oxa1 family membrane protein insertase